MTAVGHITHNLTFQLLDSIRDIPLSSFLLLARRSVCEFLTCGGTKVWALLPGVAEPRCIFSKVTEKRFPSKNEVISRLVDALKV